jgi:CubicO group peptidase (beta-lactamase class C family)
MQTMPQIDQVLGKAIDAGDVPGVVAVAATRDGPVYAGAFGKRALPDGPNMTVDSVFWIASMTKAITSSAAMQLVERGKLALDSAIRDVLPELASPQILEGFDPSGEPKLRPAKRPITLRHLITHTAGFGYDIWNPDLLRYEEKKGIPGIISCENLALTMPLAFDPGERWDYGINIDWIGKAVERVSGQQLGDYFRDNLFAPLGMKDTAFHVPAAKLDRFATSYMVDPQTHELVVYDPAEGGDWSRPPVFPNGAGGLVSTADDYLAFARMMLNHGSHGRTRILSRPSVELMATDQLTPEQKARSGFGPDSFADHGWGFCLQIVTWRTQFASLGSYGWSGGMGTLWENDPHEELVTILMTQRGWESSTPAGVFVDFWTLAYAAIDN